jgi:hypothetical protein
MSMTSKAKKDDLVIVESKSRISTLSARTAAPIYSMFRIGIVASASKDGIAKTYAPFGIKDSRVHKIADVAGLVAAHVVAKEKIDVAGALVACEGKDFTNIDEVRAFFRSFLK